MQLVGMQALTSLTIDSNHLSDSLARRLMRLALVKEDRYAAKKQRVQNALPADRITAWLHADSLRRG